MPAHRLFDHAQVSIKHFAPDLARFIYFFKLMPVAIAAPVFADIHKPLALPYPVILSADLHSFSPHTSKQASSATIVIPSVIVLPRDKQRRLDYDLTTTHRPRPQGRPIQPAVLFGGCCIRLRW